MKLLTIDTSTSTCSVALTSDGELVAEYLVNLEKPHTGHLLEGVDTVLRGGGMTLGDIDGFGVALGPGSFTGLRVGVATVKGLALATGKQVAGFSSLAMLAMNLPMASYPVCPMFDARKMEVYTALYECRELPRAVVADCVLPPMEFLATLTGTTIFVGEGSHRYREVIEAALGDRALFSPVTANTPRASNGALLADDMFLRDAIMPLAAISPVYIRPSEAELAKRQRERL